MCLQKLSLSSTLLLAYSSLGIIYGDIGTSPLYVFARWGGVESTTLGHASSWSCMELTGSDC